MIWGYNLTENVSHLMHNFTFFKRFAMLKCIHSYLSFERYYYT